MSLTNRFLSLTLLALPALLPTSTYAHGDHAQAPLQPNDENDWATVHMASEHHISNFDPSSFFALHDYDSDGSWEPLEILRTYGMAEGSTDGMGGEGTTSPVTNDQKLMHLKSILEIFDTDRNGAIDRDEFMDGSREGKKLPDLGLGPGHHGDDEYEYEIHHFERFHDENTREEDLTHPEDIAHFRKHDEMYDEADRQEAQDAMGIVEDNIPAKFRRQQ